MVIDDLDVLGAKSAPHEADPPLLVDPDAPLSGPITAKRFQSIARRQTKIAKRRSRIDCDQFSCGNTLELPPRCRTSARPEEAFGAPVGEALDHHFNLPYVSRIFKGQDIQKSLWHALPQTLVSGLNLAPPHARDTVPG